ncbi:hypothetical protein PIB30_042736 [Stylosanthes scabra]|uniref:Uncharacterized protein n=1 Tax=Stylosanthes scabra TaxID=79078 RepID=A0ABU6RFD0_9FABA|nr:hypothetical protein [Stylosanthes scabra]
MKSKNPLYNEILISDEHCFVNREALLTLAPGEEVQEERMALVPDEWDADTIDYFMMRYMGKVEDCTKIMSIPILRKWIGYIYSNANCLSHKSCCAGFYPDT